MDDLILARAFHVIGVVIWIGGVAMVTAVLLPARFRSLDQHLEAFELIERRFSWIARAMTVLVGATGLYMTWKMHLWDRFSEPSFWWMHAMVCIWFIFSTVLFVAEPLFLHQLFLDRARINPKTTLKVMKTAHWILLIASLLTIGGAVAGSHGWL